MANFLTHVITPDNSRYEFHDSEFIVDNRTIGGPALTGVSTATELFDGMQITYWLNNEAGENATLNLALAGGTTTGAIPCYYGGTTRLGTQFSKGNVIRLIYRENVTIGTDSIARGWWAETEENDVKDIFTTSTDQNPYIFRALHNVMPPSCNRELSKIVGGTIRWNQLIGYNTMGANKTEAGITFTKDTDGSLKISGKKTSNANTYYLLTSSTLLSGHKYFINGANTANANVGGATGGYNIFCRYTGGGVSFAKQYSNPTIIAPSTSSAATFGLEIQVGYMSAGNTFNDTIYPVCIDLTLLFGATIADYIYSLEHSNKGAGAAWFCKLFPNRYYSYNTGELMSVKTSTHKTVGFNQFDKDKAVNGKRFNTTGITNTTSEFSRSDWIRVIPNTTYYFKDVVGYSNMGAIYWYDANKNCLSSNHISGASPKSGYFTSPANSYYVGINFRAVDVDSVCVSLRWDGKRDGNYEPYEEHIYPLDADLELRGIPKLDANNDLYYDGDLYESDGIVTRKYGIVDLGTLSWTYDSSTNRARANVSNLKLPSSSSLKASIITDKYTQIRATGTLTEGQFAVLINNPNNLIFYYSGTPITGYMVYELATPTTETADSFANSQIVDYFGTEEYIDTGTEAGNREVSVPVGQISQYQNDIHTKLETSPDMPVVEGDYVLRRSKGVNSYTQAHNSEFIVDNRVAAGAALTGVSKAAKLFDGMQITYWLNYASDTDATLNLTLADGTTTGPIPCYYSGNVRLSIQYPPGNIIHFTYRVNPQVEGNVLPSGWWANINYDASTETDIVDNPIIIPDAEAGSSVDINTSATYIFHSSSVNLIDPTWTNQSTHTFREFGKITEDGSAVASSALYGTSTSIIGTIYPAGTYYFYFNKGTLPTSGTGKLEYSINGTNYTVNENTSFTVTSDFTLRRIYMSTSFTFAANKTYTYSAQLERGNSFSSYSIPTVVPKYLTSIVSPVTVANFEGYNYYFADALMTIISNNLINDNVATSRTTYSSNKILELLESEIPEPPDSPGMYALKCSVSKSGGVISKQYLWYPETIY